jgi:hypothetical protein
MVMADSVGVGETLGTAFDMYISGPQAMLAA